MREYFVLDLRETRLLGYRLEEASSRAYQRLMPQHGVIPSVVLGLGLALEDDRIRFHVGDAMLPEAEELIARLDHLIRDVLERCVAAAEARAEKEAKARRAADRARRAAEGRAAKAEAESGGAQGG